MKTNVLFFTRGQTENDNTREVWVYDLRTNMPRFGKRTPLMRKHFEGFITAYQAGDRRSVTDERFNVFTREEIAAKDNNLDIGLITDATFAVDEHVPDPIDSAEEAIAKLEQAIALLTEVVTELRDIEHGKTYDKPEQVFRKTAVVSGANCDETGVCRSE